MTFAGEELVDWGSREITGINPYSVGAEPFWGTMPEDSLIQSQFEPFLAHCKVSS